MSFLAPKPKAPQAPPPVPQVDDAALRRNESDRVGRRGRATTLLTGESGLPDLGSTRATTATGQ